MSVSTNMAKVTILDQKDFYSSLADAFAAEAKKAIKSGGRFTVSLAGGSTPAGLYEELAKCKVLTKAELAKVFFFFGDERDVSPESARSNFKLARDLFFRPAGVQAQNVIRWPTEIIDAREVAVKYGQAISRFFKLEAGEFPRFDLVLLGLGADCHTASLFPNTEALKVTDRIAVMNRVEKLDTNRLTLTFPVFNNAAKVIFAVAGEEKAQAVCDALEGERNCTRFPAQCVEPEKGDVVWLVEKSAASLLSKGKKAKGRS